MPRRQGKAQARPIGQSKIDHSCLVCLESYLQRNGRTKGPSSRDGGKFSDVMELSWAWGGCRLTKGSMTSTSAMIRSCASAASISASETGRPRVKLRSRSNWMFSLSAS